MATHSSTLAWQIPWTEETGRLQFMGLQRVRHDWAISLSLSETLSMLLLLLSHFGSVRLCATPSPGFSIQEYWSGLPFPSPMHNRERWKWSRSVMSDSSRSLGSLGMYHDFKWTRRFLPHILTFWGFKFHSVHYPLISFSASFEMNAIDSILLQVTNLINMAFFQPYKCQSIAQSNCSWVKL